jgi:cytochrome P450
VIFNSASAYRSIYGNKANVRKGDIYKVWRQKLNVVSTLTEVDNTTHARKKRLLTAAFTDKAIRSAETFIIQHVDRFCDLLDGPIKTNEPQNMAELADYLVFDIMCDLSFGKSFDLKEPRPNPLKTVPHTFDNFTIFMSNVSKPGFWLFSG